MTIEEHLTKLKAEKETLTQEIDFKTSRLIEVKKIIKDTEKHLEKAKEALGK
jgi:chromosome segregation ATPase